VSRAGISGKDVSASLHGKGNLLGYALFKTVDALGNAGNLF